VEWLDLLEHSDALQNLVHKGRTLVSSLHEVVLSSNYELRSDVIKR
jgi:hypothetical protein